MDQQQFHPTDQAITAWNQLTFWMLAIDDTPPDVVYVDPRQVTKCPLCRAAMPAGAHECPNCGMEIDL